MLTLYHAANAVCAAKVRLVLAEKGIEFESRLLDLFLKEQQTPEYLKLNPEGVVPTLVHDGRVVVESTVINEYLDVVFPDRPLRPADPYGRARGQLWTRREDSIHGVINTFTSVAVFRPDLLAGSAEKREERIANLPDPSRRAKLRELVELGASSPLVEEACVTLARHLKRMEAALQRSEWLNGDRFELSDAGLVSFFHRLELLRMTFVWDGIFDRVGRWYAACKARPSFTKAIGEYVPGHVTDRYAQAGSVVAPAFSSTYGGVLAAMST